MRSKDVAEAAHVSIRTLRHYHDLGLLPEPQRSENGYRDYSALDVARVLRIKRLASLGFSLADIATLDHASNADYEATLEKLDATLVAQIEALQQQRRIIAELRAEHLDPTLPPEFARAIKYFYGEQGLLDEVNLTEEDKAALLIASNLYSESDSAELERFATEAQRIGAIDKLRSLDARISTLPADTSQDEQTNLVREAMTTLEPLLKTFDPANWVEEDAGDWSLFDSLIDATHNPARKAVIDRIEAEIVARMRERANTHQTAASEAH